jgi:hypothetical protein
MIIRPDMGFLSLLKIPEIAQPDGMRTFPSRCAMLVLGMIYSSVQKLTPILPRMGEAKVKAFKGK